MLKYSLPRRVELKTRGAAEALVHNGQARRSLSCGAFSFKIRASQQCGERTRRWGGRQEASSAPTSTKHSTSEPVPTQSSEATGAGGDGAREEEDSQHASMRAWPQDDGQGRKVHGWGEIRKAGSRRRGSKDLHEYEEVGGRRSRGGGRRALLFGQDLAGGLKRRRLQ
jgi:hypothetical protein